MEKRTYVIREIYVIISPCNANSKKLSARMKQKYLQNGIRIEGEKVCFFMVANVMQLFKYIHKDMNIKYFNTF